MMQQRAAAAAMEHVNGGVRHLHIGNGRRSGGGGGGGSVGDAAAVAVSAVVLEEWRLAREVSATLLLLCAKQCSGKCSSQVLQGELLFAPGSAILLPGALLCSGALFFCFDNFACKGDSMNNLELMGDKVSPRLSTHIIRQSTGILLANSDQQTTHTTLLL
jgi:hypothetical protein